MAPSATGSAQEKGLPTRSLDVLVAGAGFGGLYQLHCLRKLGYNCKVVDSAGEIGGVWYWNCYPGARVDSNAPLYEYSIEELYKEWTWTERFPGYSELRKYFQYVDRKLDLSKDIELNTKVVAASFDTITSRWNVHLSTGEVVNTRFFVLCTGFAAKRYVPDFAGLDQYKGEMCHTAVYPQEGIDMKGKKVAVIGTGASGVQCIQEIAQEVSHLTVFQRTPNLCLPMNQHGMDAETENRLKKDGDYERSFKLRRETFSGLDFDWYDKDGDEENAEQKKELFEKLWAAGGFRIWLSNYRDLLLNRKVNDEVYKFWAEKTRARINDPTKRDLLAPLLDKQPHTFGTKRPCLEQRYFEVYNQKNVDIISLKEIPIQTFTEKGLKLSDGRELEFDVIVLATGFDSVTGGLVQIDIEGTNGITLKDKWAKGTGTYLGMTTANFPNMFFLYGPHGPTAFANGPTIVELQGDWIIDAIEYTVKHGKKTIDPTQQSEAGWTKHVADLCDITLLPYTQSWYMGDNIPGKPRESLNYIGGLARYVRETREIADKGYAGFNFDVPYDTGTQV